MAFGRWYAVIIIHVEDVSCITNCIYGFCMAWVTFILEVYRISVMVEIYWTQGHHYHLLKHFSLSVLLAVPSFVKYGMRSVTAVLALNLHALQHAALDIISEYLGADKCPMRAPKGVLLKHTPHLGNFIRT
jgi:hypothetical protein